MYSRVALPVMPFHLPNGGIRSEIWEDFSKIQWCHVGKTKMYSTDNLTERTPAVN